MRSIPSILSLFFLWIGSTGIISVGISVAEAATRPNVLVILADDLGFSDLGCYGSEIHTPNLDGLAAGGLKFTQFYNTARCWPTRAALLTGYYAQQIRRDTLPDVPRGNRPAWARLLPEMLSPLGYRSYHSGKWHLDGKPVQCGFDRSYRMADHGRYFNPQRHFLDDKPLPPIQPDSGYYTTTAIADHAIGVLREHAEKYPEQPFLEYLAFTAPHFPLHALPEDIARYQGKYQVGWDTIRKQRWQRIQALGLVDGSLSEVEPEVGPPYDFPEALTTLGPEETNRPLPWNQLTPGQQSFQAMKMTLHAAMIDRMDREIGRVLQQLRTMGAIENTLIFFLSDNGASAEIMVRDDGHDRQASPGSAATYLCLGPGWSNTCNTPFRRHKTWTHEGGIHTPLIAHWPLGISVPGQLRRNLGHVIDLVPTILAATGGQRFETWQGQPVPPPPGKSLLPIMTGNKVVTRESVWWSHEGNRALRVGDWKLVAAGSEGSWELYNLNHDPTETNNLAKQHPEKVHQLQQAWLEHQDKFSVTATADLKPQQKP
ncbi:MAG: arylsulfatase [Pirellulales bacterium]